MTIFWKNKLDQRWQVPLLDPTGSASACKLCTGCCCEKIPDLRHAEGRLN